MITFTKITNKEENKNFKTGNVEQDHRKYAALYAQKTYMGFL